MILLDTHAAIWYAGGHTLKRAAVAAIETALPERGVMLSAISAWEIGMLVEKQRLTLHQSASDYIAQLFQLDGVREEPVTAEIGTLASSLVGFHPDPADRLIVATAIVRSVPLLTRDERIIRYLRKTKLTSVVAA